jgi:hypothetical protein
MLFFLADFILLKSTTMSSMSHRNDCGSHVQYSDAEVGSDFELLDLPLDFTLPEAVSTDDEDEEDIVVVDKPRRILALDTSDSEDSSVDLPLITLKKPPTTKPNSSQQEGTFNKKIPPTKKDADKKKEAPKKKTRESKLLPPKKPFVSKTSSPPGLQNPYNKTPNRYSAPVSASTPASARRVTFSSVPDHHWGAHADLNKTPSKRYPVIHQNKSVDLTSHSYSSPSLNATVDLTSNSHSSTSLTAVQKQRVENKKTQALRIREQNKAAEKGDREMAQRLADSFEDDHRAANAQARADRQYNETAHANGSRAEDFSASRSIRSTLDSPRRMTVPSFPNSMYEDMSMEQFLDTLAERVAEAWFRKDATIKALSKEHINWLQEPRSMSRNV